MTCVCSRMRMRGERFSSGVKKAATPPSPAFPRTFRAPTGSLGSPLWPRTATSCLRARQNRSRNTGSLHLRPLSTDPCCPRIMQVNLGFICVYPQNSSDSEGCFGTFSLQWRRFLNTNHDSVEDAGWAARRMVACGAFVYTARITYQVHAITRGDPIQLWRDTSSQICSTRAVL